ncbi:hypothetical protein TNCV_4515601 [Trichonephila clavipes]|nr:hypothetical protein TNCV_4515601 [Trichonephila clavipes]
MPIQRDKPSHLGEKTEDMPIQRDKPSHIGEKTKDMPIQREEPSNLDRPPNRDICSCTSASNGHVYYDGLSSSWPSWIVVPLSLSFKFEDYLTLGIPLR